MVVNTTNEAQSGSRGIDDWIEAYRGYVDHAAGLAETYVEVPAIPSAHVLLTTPVEAKVKGAFVICPAFGHEHGNIRRLESRIARRLARAGFATIRLRPDGGVAAVDLEMRLTEADSAIDVLAARAQMEVGTIGILTGGMVAALVAGHRGLEATMLIEPVTSGRQWLREALRRQAVAQLWAAQDAQDGPAIGDASLRELQTRGETTIRGLRLTQAQHDAIASTSLSSVLTGYRGRTAIVAVSGGANVSPGLRKLHDQLVQAGGTATLVTVPEPPQAPFGDYHYVNVGPVRVDTRIALDAYLAELVSSWAEDDVP